MSTLLDLLNNRRVSPEGLREIVLAELEEATTEEERLALRLELDRIDRGNI